SAKNQATPRRTRPARTSPKPGTNRLSNTPNHLLFETVGEDCITADDESSIIAAVQRNYRVFKVKTKTLRSFTLIFASRYCGISEMVSRWRRQLEAPG